MLTADTWPIAAAMLPQGNADPVGSGPAPAERWLADLSEVAAEGFDLVDLTDSWIHYGDLTAPQLGDLKSALAEAGVGAASMSAIRRSIIDEEHGERHLAYLHRCIDAAAFLGAEVVSVGLHRALTPEQSHELWFWTAPGHRDPDGDADAWDRAVHGFRELGAHASDVGLLLSLEMYEDTYLGTAASAVRLVEDIGDDAVGLNPDIGNLIRLARPVEGWRELLEATLPYANFWHVKNYARYEDAAAGLAWAVPTYLEAGVIDYRAAVKTALANGFQGVICTEHYGGDGLSMSAANRDYLRRRVLPKGPVALGDSRVRQAGPRRETS
jgi:sugar phosphate isomerase/epimerase